MAHLSKRLEQRAIAALDSGTLAVNVWFMDRASEPQLFATIGRILNGGSTFRIIGEVVAALDYYPGHKLALTRRAARVRDVAL